MRFLLRVDSHARNHSAHPQAQSQVAALRTYPAARSARAFQRRAPRAVLCLRQYYCIFRSSSRYQQ